MTRVLTISAILFLASTAPSREDSEPDRAAKAELKLLAGEWKIVAAEMEGAKTESKTIVKFEAGKCTLTDPGFPAIVNTLTLDSSKTPKWMDLANPKTGASFPGIYELKGDTLLAAFLPEKLGRPTQFKTKKGEPGVMFTYERIKSK